MSSVLKVNEIQHTGGTSALTIDSNGTILMPQKPAWRLGLTANQSETTTGGTGQLVVWNQTSSENCFTQGDLSYSSGVLTTNVAGVYQFNANIRINGVGSGYIVVRITINDVTTGVSETYSIDGSPDASYITKTAVDVFKLNAGDEVRIRAVSSSDGNWEIDSASSFSGYLIG